MNTNLTMVRGNVRQLRIQVTDPPEDGQVVGLPTNLTGKRLIWTAKLDVNGSATITKSSATGGIVIADPESGVGIVEIAAADTSGLAYNSALVWTVQLDNNPGNEQSVCSGTLQIISEYA